MNARTPVYRDVILCLLLAVFSLAQSGCTKPEPHSDLNATAYAASGGIPPQVAQSQQSDSAERSEDPKDPASPVAETQKAEQVRTPLTIAGADIPATPTPEYKLQADLTPEQLLTVLSGADQDMQTILSGRSGITDPREARNRLINIVKLKLEASQRLSKHPKTTAEARSEGTRGELQALSHLASFGDVKVAEQLERLATANLESDDVKLVADSRLVLIGFAIESLQNGNEKAADRIINYVDQIAASKTNPGVPSMMVMGQARQTLADYGHDEQAQHVRGTILELFADSSEPEIARMAAQLAGNVHFDAIDKLVGNVIDGQSVAANDWHTAVVTLVGESPDLQTVRYLAGAALEFESLGQKELSDLTYQVMAKQFTDPASATGQELQIATAAREARRSVVGRKFDPDLARIDGSSLSLADYKGKVVVMPFWAMASPESLQLIPQLKSIREKFADDVAIVGMNMDAAEAPVGQFLKANDLGFPSFHAASPATRIALAEQFGMVAMPFTAIIDQEGRVAAINFRGRDLEQIVQALVAR